MSADFKQVAGIALTFFGGGFGRVLFSLAGLILANQGARQAAKEAEKEAKERARSESASRNIKANVRGSSEVHFLCFGKIRVGGIVVALGRGLSGGPNRNKLYMGLAHSICHPGGCEGVESIWINDERVLAADINGDSLTSEALVTKSKFVVGSDHMITFRHYRGTDDQAADAILTSEDVTGGGADYFRYGVSWTRFTLTRPVDDPEEFSEAFPNGVPNITVLLKGIRCYDPRLDSNNGGSGGHRFADYDTWAWTQNSALIAATYMIMEESDGGMGHDPSEVDWPSVAAAANICDETVSNAANSPTVSQARYRCDIALDTSRSREVNLRAILDTMMGERVRIGGKYKIHAGASTSPTFTLDESYLRGPVKISTRAPLEQLYNAVRITHDDEDQNFRTVEAPPFTSTAYEAQDGNERIWREESRPGIINSYQAQYIATVLGQFSRKQKIIEAPCNLKALDLEVWETGTVTLGELGIDGAVYRLISWEWEGDGPKLILREEDADVWEVATYVAPVQNETPSVTTEPPGRPQGFAATAAAGGVILTWTGPPPLDAPFVDIYRASGTGSPQVFSLLKSGVLGTAYVDEPSDSTTYHYKIQRRNYQGALSEFSPEKTAATGSLKISGSGTRLGDERNATALLSLNRQPAVQTSSNPLSAADVGATVDINIAAHSVQIATGTISYGAGSISGATFSTVYYVYANDPTFAGTSTYAATLTFTTVVASSGRYYVGTITTPADGGGGTSGTGGQQFEP